MKLPGPEGRVHPLLGGESKDLLDLRTRVARGRRVVGFVYVEDRRHALRELSVGLDVQVLEVLVHRRLTTPASRAIRGTTLVRSIHSPGAWSSPPTGPSPSNEGAPAALVELASEAPPVDAS